MKLRTERLKKFQMSVTRKFLKGHKDAVISLCNSDDRNVLFSASDDWTARMWDVREKHTATRLFKIDGEGDVGFVHVSSDLLTVSRGSGLVGFDLRQSNSIIVSTPSFVYRGIEEEDINDFDIGSESILIPTDSGTVREIDRRSFVEKSTSHTHGNIASVCRFLPSGDQFVSGGYDCRVCTGKLCGETKEYPVRSLIPIDEDEESSSRAQTVNPPFVTGLEVSPTRRDRLGISLGDGSVLVMDIRRGGSKLDMRRPAWGGSSIHSSSVASLSWSSDGDSIWSVGTDSVLVKMDEHCIRVRYSLEGYKPNSVAELEPQRVAVAGTVNEIEVIDFR